MIENALVCADNQALLENTDLLPDESVALAYLDPPFGSGGLYALTSQSARSTPRSSKPSVLYSDVWPWNDITERTLHDLRLAQPKAAEVIDLAASVYGQNDLAAYLTMMAARLVPLRRVLAANASLYLHCDPTAAFALRMLLDAVFGPASLRREIVWRTGWVSGFKARSRNWVRNHDVILYLATGPQPTFHVQRQPHPKGYRRRGGGANLAGVVLDDVWTDIPSPGIMSFSREKTGFPTQKPLRLLERIIAASSNPGDLVLDPFCGSGTSLVAAQRLGRRATGFDCQPLALAVARARLLAEQGRLPPGPGVWPVHFPSSSPADASPQWQVGKALCQLGAYPVAVAGRTLPDGELRAPDGHLIGRVRWIERPAEIPSALSDPQMSPPQCAPIPWCLIVGKELPPHPPGQGVTLPAVSEEAGPMIALDDTDLAVLDSATAWRPIPTIW